MVFLLGNTWQIFPKLQKAGPNLSFRSPKQADVSWVHTPSRHTQRQQIKWAQQRNHSSHCSRDSFGQKLSRSSNQPSPSWLGLNRLESTAQTAEPGVMPAAAGGELTMTFPVPNAYGKNQVPCKNTGSPSLFQHHTDGQEVFSEWLTVPDPRAWC